MTRVLLVVPHYPYPILGGLERQAHELAKALMAIGVRVEALSGKVWPGQQDREMVEGVRVHRIVWFQTQWLRFVFTPLAMFVRLIRLRKQFDVIHLHHPNLFGLLVILTSKALGIPILTKLPNVGHWGLPGLRSEMLGALKLKILLSSDALVAMCQESLDELSEARFPAQRILAVPNGIRIESDDPGRDQAEGLLKIAANTNHWTGVKTGSEPCRVVFVGRLAVEKQPDALLRAWRAAIGRTNRQAVLEIWGVGPLEAETRRLCAKLGLSDSVIFRGHIDAVREHLPKMDVFFMASRVEGNSNSVLEAMAAGLPIVATRVGGTAMQVGPNGEALLCAPDEEARLAEILSKVIESDELRTRLGAEMRQRVAQLFSIEKIAPVYAQAYQLLAQRQGARMHTLARTLAVAPTPATLNPSRHRAQRRA